MDQADAKFVSRGPLNLRSLLAVLWFFRRVEKSTDRDRPEIVSTNAKSKAVLDCAKQLAADEREDRRAITELKASAKNRRRTLRAAERASRFMGYHHELARANLTNRLLKAALAREAVPSPPTAQDKARIEAVESFNRLARDQQWDLLVELQPALVELASEMRAGRFGPIATRNHDSLKDRTSLQETADGERQRVITLSPSDPPSTEEEMRELRHRASGHMELMTQLRPLVGPRRGDDNPLLKSQRALDIANSYLLRPPS